MKLPRVSATTCVLMLLCFPISEAVGQKGKPHVLYSPPSFMKAEAFMEMDEANRMLYTEGLMDGFLAGSWLGATDETVTDLTNCTKGMDTKQLAAIITKWVKDHPEQWQYPVSSEAILALSKICPGQIGPK